jgi:prepilin-type N-terminal cleavage/methylation domain-containing protein
MKSIAKSLGFTLTEVMVVVGVIAALAIGGMGMYSNSIAKSQVDEGLEFAFLLRDSVTDAYEASGTAGSRTLPAAGFNDFGLNPGGYVSEAITITGSVVEVVFSSKTQKAVSGHYLKFTPTAGGAGDHLSWACTTDIKGGRFDGTVQGATEQAILVSYPCVTV